MLFPRAFTGNYKEVASTCRKVASRFLKGEDLVSAIGPVATWDGPIALDAPGNSGGVNPAFQAFSFIKVGHTRVSFERLSAGMLSVLTEPWGGFLMLEQHSYALFDVPRVRSGFVDWLGREIGALDSLGERFVSFGELTTLWRARSTIAYALVQSGIELEKVQDLDARKVHDLIRAIPKQVDGKRPVWWKDEWPPDWA